MTIGPLVTSTLRCDIAASTATEVTPLGGGVDQRAAALRFADPRVQALLHVLLLFLLVQGTTASLPRDCGQHFSTPGSMIAHYVPDWLSSHSLQAIRYCPWTNPSGPLKPPSTTGMNMQNLQHKNLTQSLHKVLDPARVH